MTPDIDETRQQTQDMIARLNAVRSRYADELADPTVRAQLYGITHAEVGGQGPQAQQAFMESVFNRAAARGQSLSQTLGDRRYFPRETFDRAARGAPSDMLPLYDTHLQSVLGGSNLAQFATGNASGGVGFAGGPQTYSAGGERFGIEGPDRKWATEVSGGGPMPPMPPMASNNGSASSAFGGPMPPMPPMVSATPAQTGAQQPAGANFLAPLASAITRQPQQQTSGPDLSTSQRAFMAAMQAAQGGPTRLFSAPQQLGAFT